MLVIGDNPTDAHPVFVSRMKKHLRDGAKAIVADPRRIDLVRSPHVEAALHLPEATEDLTGIPASNLPSAAGLFAAGPNSAISYGPGVTERCQGSTMAWGWPTSRYSPATSGAWA